MEAAEAVSISMEAAGTSMNRVKTAGAMASVRKTVSVPTGNSAGTVLVYIAVT